MNEEAPKPKKEVLRIYFADFTFKSFAIDQATSVAKLKASVFRKMRWPDSQLYKLYYTGDRLASRELDDGDNVVQIRLEAEERDFVVGFKFVVSKEAPNTSYSASVDSQAGGAASVASSSSPSARPQSSYVAAPAPAAQKPVPLQRTNSVSRPMGGGMGGMGGGARAGLASLMMGGGGAAGSLVGVRVWFSSCLYCS
jgi:hypothetical protein